ncbi:MAG: hypothetical protein ABIY56_10250 [Dokdonella sp.]
MRLLACTTAAVLSFASISIARAAPFAYGMAYDQLYQIDLGARRAEFVGSAGSYGTQRFGNLKALSFSPDGQLYAISDSISSKPLLRIDPQTGAGSYVAALNLGDFGSGQYNSVDFASAFTCDGRLWVSSATARKLWRVNPRDGSSQLVGDLATGITGLVAHGDTLYGAAGRGDNQFYRIDTDTAATHAMGAFGTGNNWVTTLSMSFGDDGTLWSVLNYLPPEPGSSALVDWSDLATMDPANGKLRVLGPITGPANLRGVGINGLAMRGTGCPISGDTDPPLQRAEPARVPLDAPWALLALILLSLAASARHLRQTIR